MRVDEFDFDLPAERIALRPARPRDSSRLLVVQPDCDKLLLDRQFADLPSFLNEGDILVFNDTRVIPARLKGLRLSESGPGARVEVTLHQRKKDDTWLAFLRPAKKVAVGDRLQFGGASNTCFDHTLNATVMAKGDGGEAELRFDFAGPALDAAIAGLGELPLPPYIASKRAVDDNDVVDYQTEYASNEGAVAAPTAGLHFTDDIFRALKEKQIKTGMLTLHVGAGTFLPVKVEDTRDHRMHHEWGEVSPGLAARVNEVRADGGRVVAVGTTVMRLLESAARDDGSVQPFSGSTDIFIEPGYRCKVVDALITNFHLPRSTLFMLVSAFCGLDVMKQAYSHAIEHEYRFYSYGDSSLLFRPST